MRSTSSGIPPTGVVSVVEKALVVTQDWDASVCRPSAVPEWTPCGPIVELPGPMC
jgi:hypothetical protein